MSSRCINFYNNHKEKYEDTVNKLKYLLNKDSIIFDIGSNIGLFSLAICKLDKYSKLYLFEPVSEYLSFSKNLLSSYKNIEFENIALGDEIHDDVIYKDKADNIGWNTLYKNDPFQPNNIIPVNHMDSESVKVDTLTNYCIKNNIQKIDFIKIDVEGYEFKVLSGFFEFLKTMKHKPYLYIEVGWGTKHPEWNTVKNIYDQLFLIGYKPITFSHVTEDILFKPL
jgi:FkbM family methyltransferase